MIYISLFLQSFFAASLIPLSSEVYLLWLQSQGYAWPYLFLVAGLGNSLGSTTSYALGYYALWPILKKYFRIQPQQISKWQRLGNNYSALLSFFCWLPVFGDLFAVSLGSKAYCFWRFLAWMSLGKFLRYYLLLQGWWYLGS